MSCYVTENKSGWIINQAPCVEIGFNSKQMYVAMIENPEVNSTTPGSGMTSIQRFMIPSAPDIDMLYDFKAYQCIPNDERSNENMILDTSDVTIVFSTLAFTVREGWIDSEHPITHIIIKYTAKNTR